MGDGTRDVMMNHGTTGRRRIGETGWRHQWNGVDGRSRRHGASGGGSHGLRGGALV